MKWEIIHVPGKLPYSLEQSTNSLIMEPEPVDPVVLYLQGTHRSNTCARDISTIKTVDHFSKVRSLTANSIQVRDNLKRAGFLHYSRLDYIRLDRALITSLVERWRPETNTFHLRVGEMSFTLQDVAVLLGLRIDGDAVLGDTSQDWVLLCAELLGKVPDPDDMRGGSVRLTWLREEFEEPGSDGTQEEFDQYTRAYILHHIGIGLFTDTSRNMVHLKWLPLLDDFDKCGGLSWGSAVLSYLYSELTIAALNKRKLICGCLTLFQIWSWTRLSIGRPTLLHQLSLDGEQPLGCRFNVPLTWDIGPNRSILFYRNELDQLDEASVEWQPYIDDVLDSLPPLCLEGADIWRAHTPILCFHTIEMHLPDRILRQFGLIQHIPIDVERLDSVVRSTIWFNQQVERWNARYENIIEQQEPEISLAEYRRWYWRITRRYILQECAEPTTYVPRGPIERDLVQGIFRAYEIVTDASRGRRDLESSVQTVKNLLFCLIEKHSLTDDYQPPSPPLPPLGPPRPPVTQTFQHRGQLAQGEGTSQISQPQLKPEPQPELGLDHESKVQLERRPRRRPRSDDVGSSQPVTQLTDLPGHLELKATKKDKK